MLWFHHRTDEKASEGKDLRATDESEQAETVAALQRGGIPVQAHRRLDALRQREGAFFTSALSVNEFALVREGGLQALSHVAGSSVVYLGSPTPPAGRARELKSASEGLNAARTRALKRLAEEARCIGADVVIGVRIARTGRTDVPDTERVMTFDAMGTAVKMQGAPLAHRPVLTTLSVQDFWKLSRAGYQPLGIVAASVVFYSSALEEWQWNREQSAATKSFSRARKLLMKQVEKEAERLEADGVVGMVIESAEEECEVEGTDSEKHAHFLFTWHALGTAIAGMGADVPAPSVSPGVDLRSY